MIVVISESMNMGHGSSLMQLLKSAPHNKSQYFDGKMSEKRQINVSREEKTFIKTETDQRLKKWNQREVFSLW